ncbi:ABC transporter permease [Fluviicola chungangensis]|uniref:ABC transporter permease subunit n=1 Tax=Fluviicola chungangensis TaxID=2597671 RepID=A0A556MMR9_9FLAO|nr:ABC transporter permease subunit [Fluviicola chungangensis]TSJ41175.1 ABC transporter permease subunit [Fluviicola chungangensis]
MLFKNTTNEFIKIVSKPRSYLGLGALTLLIGLIIFAMKADGESMVSFVTATFEQTLSFNGKLVNGNLIAFIILQMLVVHIPLLIALVTGDLISGEAAMGTIRMLASKPISRTQIVLSKFIAGAIYTLVITLWLGILSLVVSHLVFGAGDLMVLNSDGLVILPEADILWRFGLAFCVAYLSLLTVATLSICLSAFAENSIGPIVATMAIIIVFTIIGSLDVTVFDTIKPYLFTTHMASWRSFFEDPVPFDDILNSIVILLAHIVLLVGITLFKFNRKDITS